MIGVAGDGKVNLVAWGVLGVSQQDEGSEEEDGEKREERFLH